MTVVGCLVEAPTGSDILLGRDMLAIGGGSL